MQLGLKLVPVGSIEFPLIKDCLNYATMCSSMPNHNLILDASEIVTYASPSLRAERTELKVALSGIRRTIGPIVEVVTAILFFLK